MDITAQLAAEITALKVALNEARAKNALLAKSAEAMQAELRMTTHACCIFAHRNGGEVSFTFEEYQAAGEACGLKVHTVIEDDVVRFRTGELPAPPTEAPEDQTSAAGGRLSLVEGSAAPHTPTPGETIDTQLELPDSPPP